MTLIDRAKELIEKSKKATKVVSWYPHGYDGTVRGPYQRWFKVSEVSPEYQKYVGTVDADTEFAAAAMNDAAQLAAALIEAVELIGHFATLERLPPVSGAPRGASSAHSASALEAVIVSDTRMARQFLSQHTKEN